MQPTRRAPLLLLLLPLLCLPGPARGGTWERSARLSGESLVSLSAPTPEDVFVAGLVFDTSSGWLPVARCRVKASSDGGRYFQPIDAPLAGLAQCAPSDLVFVDAQTGWLLAGSSVWRTTNRGAAWAESPVGFDAASVHFFNTLRGILVGSGGAIRQTVDGGVTWSPIQSPTAIDLRGQHWLDDRRGWAFGYRNRTEVDPDTEESSEWPEEGVILGTSDGGATWTVLATPEGLGLGPVFFLGDARTGFVAAWERVAAERTVAHLLRTVDGGRTLEALAFPTQVGTYTTGAVHTGWITAMHWSDDQTGHLAGSAFVTRTDEPLQQKTTLYHVNVDYLTRDGGLTWARTELGSISGFPAPNLQNDGATADGLLSGLYSGWLVGEESVWTYVHTCAGDADCAGGLACRGGTCAQPSGADGGTGGSDGGPGADAGSSPEEDGGSPATPDAGPAEPGDDPDAASGCACGAGGAPSALLPVALLLAGRRRATFARPPAA